MMRFLGRFDWVLFVAMLLLIATGAVFIKSAGEAREIAALHSAWRAHIWTAVVGLAAYFALAAVDYRKLLSWVAWPSYAVSIVLLAVVLFVGSTVYGGRRWLWFFQPSEVSKLAVIMLTAHVFGRQGRESFRWAVAGLALLLLPAGLILLEPDMGTAMVLLPTVVTMLLAARVWTRGLVALMLAGLLSAGILLGAVWTAERRPPEAGERIYERLPLREHQIKRLKVFMNPDDARYRYGGGWNLRQAKLSIGSGSLTGKGVGRGEQKFLGYLPPSVSMNDFIFAVLAEEAGFAGSMGVLCAFSALLAAALGIAFRSGDDRGRLLAVGVSTLVFCHVYVNVAMSVGLMPITGLPLPFISAGRTFLVVLMAALGIVQSVAVHKGGG